MREPTTLLHTPSRPDWNCSAPGCGEPWPCPTERAELLTTYQHARLLLRIYMASHMHDAIEDAVRHPLDVEIDFWPRFMGWVPHAPSPPMHEPAERQPEDHPTNSAVTQPPYVTGSRRA